MAHFDKNDLEHLKHLCRIDCNAAEDDEILSSLTKVLEYVDQLNLVETDGVLPCNFVLGSMAKNDWRADEVKTSMSRDQFLMNAPDQIAGMIRIPSVLQAAESATPL